MRDVIGNILQDEKIPGIHIAFGNPYGAHTGADWYSATHIDVVGRKFDIWIDGLQIMHGGEFLLDSLPAQQFNRELVAGRIRALPRARRRSAAASRRSSGTAKHPSSCRQRWSLEMARYGREMVDQLLADRAYRTRFGAKPSLRDTASRTKSRARSSCRPISGWTSTSGPSSSRSRASRPSTPISPCSPSAIARRTASIRRFQISGRSDTRRYCVILRAAIVGDHDPAEVVLLEIDPEHQKTRRDFVLTEQHFGVRAVDIRTSAKNGTAAL